VGVVFAVPALVAAKVAAAHGTQGNAALAFLTPGATPTNPAAQSSGVLNLGIHASQRASKVARDRGRFAP
jgi:hypothetical protein